MNIKVISGSKKVLPGLQISNFKFKVVIQHSEAPIKLLVCHQKAIKIPNHTF